MGVSVITATLCKQREAAFSDTLAVLANMGCGMHRLPGQVQQPRLSCLCLAFKAPRQGTEVLQQGYHVQQTGREASRWEASFLEAMTLFKP